ncbi:MAG: TolC family protein [Pseudomonadota bacterium]|nr:TolC family protein [Pseudomonadota bacterium]
MVSNVHAAAAAPADTGTFTFDQALERAVRRSESARSSRAGIASATESARAAGQLPDPMLRMGIDNLPVTGPDRFSTTRDFQTMKRIGISQEWLSDDKRAARTAAAQAAVGREEAQLKASLADARLQAALSYLDAFYAAEALKLTLLMEHHAHEEFEVARARLASATGSGQEVLALSSAWSMTEDDSADVRQQQGVANVALQRWVGEGLSGLVAVPDIVGLSEAAFVDGHPGVLGKEQEVRIARLEAALTATNRSPNWTFELSYGQRSGYSDMASMGVSIPLPVAPGARQDRDTAAKLALVEKAQADLAEARRTARAEYGALVIASRVLDQRIDLYRDGVVLHAQQRVEAAVAGYRSNQGTLLTLFEARRVEVEAQRKLLTLKRDLAKARAQLAYRAWSAPRDAQ